MIRTIFRKGHMAIIYAGGGRRALKEYNEFSVWKNRSVVEGGLSNHFFEEMYTSYFGLDKNFYSGKRILDVGCGPRGSLEWADNASERVGLDPLVEEFRRLGTHRHTMRYVAGTAEAIPFPDNYFDVISSFDSLKHVDDLGLAIKEIQRVLAPDGLFLLHTVIGAAVTRREPTVLTWEVVQKFVPALNLVQECHYERFFGYRDDINEFIARMKARVPYDHSDPTPRRGILSAKFQKVSIASKKVLSQSSQML